MYVFTVGLISLMINISRWPLQSSHKFSSIPVPRDPVLQTISRPTSRYGSNALIYCFAKKTHCRPVSHPHSTCLILLLILCGDVQTNPGPRPPKYPCGVCSRAFRNGQAGIQCDNCDSWWHTQCIQMCTQAYAALQNPNVSWLCDHYGLPNFSSGLFTPSISESRNSFATLSDTSLDTFSLTTELGSPIHASSPKTQRPPTKKGAPPLKVFSLNGNSVRGRTRTVNSEHS